MDQEKHFKYVILPELILLAATLLNVLMLFLNTSLYVLAFII
ncbi:hypothetical protein [Acholeplasma equirhinis]|nr:hypothetical protein [Acholeplasma equirhinis]